MKLDGTPLLFGLLFWFVGLSSWLTITSLFNELSLMVTALPEKYQLFSYLALIIQLANVVPLIYTVCIPRAYKTRIFIEYAGYIVILFSFVSMVLMAFCYSDTMLIFHQQHSVMLFIATFCASICDCMTSLIYWPWISSYPSQFISYLSAGEVSSGILASILIWSQQLNKDFVSDATRFSVKTYLLLIASLLPLSLVAFCILNKLLKNGYFETQEDWIAVKSDSDSQNLQNRDHRINQTDQHIDDSSCCYCFGTDFLRLFACCKRDNSSPFLLKGGGGREYKSIKWVCLIGLISAVQNGVIPSIASYALIQFNESVYVYAMTLSNLLRPLMAISTAYYPNLLINAKSITISCIGWILCVGYILCSAVRVNAVSQNNLFHRVLVVVIFVLCQTLITLSKTCIIMMVKKEFMLQSRSLIEINIDLKTVWDRQLGGVMERIGLGIQIGSFVGATTLFILINLIPVQLFQS